MLETKTRTKPDLEELAELAKQGDRQAADALIQATYAEGLNFSRMALKGYSGLDAEDILQEAYFKAWVNLHTFKGGNFKGWIFTIIKRTAIDKMKSTVSRLETQLDLAIELLTDERNNPEKQGLDNLRNERLQTALAALTDREREITQRFYFDNQSIREISAAMGVADSTIKNTLATARKKLDKELSGDYKRDDIFNGIAVMPILSQMLQKDIAGGMAEIPSAILQTTAAGVSGATATAAAATTTGAGTATTTATGIVAKFAALGAGIKAAIVTVSAAVVVTGVAVPVYVHNENQRAEQAALIFQQEQEAEQSRIAYEAEQSRVAYEVEQTRIAEEKAEQERIEAEKLESERIAAEKAEAEKLEAERIAAEKAEAERLAAEAEAAQKAAAEKAAQQSSQNQSNSKPSGGGGSSSQSGGNQGGGNSQGGQSSKPETQKPSGTAEAAGGPPNSDFNAQGWDSSMGAWYGTMNGGSVWMWPNGAWMVR